MAITVPAMIQFQGVTISTILDNPTVMDTFPGDEVRIIGYRYASQPLKNDKANAVVTAGSDTGRITRTSAPTLVQPSTTAASSRVTGMLSKKPFNSRIGFAIAVATMAMMISI